MNGATLGALAGFLSALVVLGVPLLGFLLALDRRTRRTLALLSGRDEVEGDGVLARLRAVESALTQSDAIDYERTAVAGDES